MGITTGANNDIQKASLNLDYINKFGMDSDLGLFNIGPWREARQSIINRCRTK